MKSEFLIIPIIILVILISGCTQTGYVVSQGNITNATNATSTITTTSATTTTIIKTNATNAASSAGSNQAKQCPVTCNDNNSCTEDKCSAETNFECTYKAITPCCGNSVCEANETCPEDCLLINISITNIHYESPEWVEINNSGNAANLTGWTLEDIVPHTYKFPDFILYTNSSVKIHTENGTNNQTDLYWNRSAQVWNTEGDNATLKDKEDNIISKYSYPLITTTTTTSTTTSSTTTTTPTTTTSTITTTTTTMPTTTTSSTTTSSSTTTTQPICGNENCEANETCPEDCPTANILNIHYQTPEWVEIKNIGIQFDLDGWTLEDLANHTYIFPPFIFQSNSTIRVHTESGPDNDTDLYWNRGDQVWNTEGDTATLKDIEGNIIAEYSYSSTTTTTVTTTSTVETSTTSTTV